MHRIFVIGTLFLVISVKAEEIYPGYTWQEVSDGIYLHSQNDPLAGPVDGNSTVIVNPDGVIVVDTHINPAVTRAVVAKINALTDTPVTHVINTHWHDDHTNGNYVYRRAFPDVKIIAHRNTLRDLREEWAPMEEQRREAYAGIDLDELQRVANDPAQAGTDTAIAYSVYHGYVAALRPELATLELEYPDTVFGESLSLNPAGRRIELRWLGRGNTDGDVVVWLPDDGVLITGDLLVFPIPFAFDSPMTDWIETLKRLAELQARIVIPGHGPVQRDAEYLHSVRALLHATVDAVRSAAEAGVTVDDLAEAVDLVEFRDRFAGDDATRRWAWQAYFVGPGLKSAWASLGHASPE